MLTKLFLLGLLFLAFICPAAAQFSGPDQQVQGYTRRDGAYVQPYHRTAPDHNPFNNYSTRGNTNPYTGERGHVNPYQQPQHDPFSSPSRARKSWP